MEVCNDCDIAWTGSNYGFDCPLCKKVEEIEELEKDIENLNDQISNLEDQI